jgi:hypothetical protein
MVPFFCGFKKVFVEVQYLLQSKCERYGLKSKARSAPRLGVLIREVQKFSAEPNSYHPILGKAFSKYRSPLKVDLKTCKPPKHPEA